MGKKKSPKYEDALQSIYDVIFAQKKQKPVKSRPTRYLNIDANKQMAEALTEIATKPLNYVSSGALNALNMYGGAELIKFYIDKRDKDDDDESGRFRIRVGDLAKLYQNPDAFVDKVFDSVKAARSAATHANIGRGLDTALTFLWAKKQADEAGIKLEPKQAWNYGLMSGDFLGSEIQSTSKRMMLENSGMKVLREGYGNRKAAREVQELLRSTPGVIKGEGGDKKLEDVLKRSSNPDISTNAHQLSQEIYRDYMGVHNSEAILGKRDPKRPDYKYISPDPEVRGAWTTAGKINRLGYNEIWNQNLIERIRTLDKSDPVKYAKQREVLAQMAGATRVMNKLRGTGNNFAWSDDIKATLAKMEKTMGQLRGKNDTFTQKFLPGFEDIYKRMQAENMVAGQKQLKEMQSRWFGNPYHSNSKYIRKAYETEIDFEIHKRAMLLDYESNLPNGSPSQKRMLEAEIKDLELQRNQFRNAPGNELWLMVGDTVSAWRSVNTYIIKGGLGQAIMDGSFFTDDGYLNPSKEGAIIFNFANKRREGVGISDGKMVIAGIRVPRTDISPAYAQLTILNYLTPASIAKTFLFNGEGFAYAGHLNRMTLGAILGRKDMSNFIKGLMASDPVKYKAFGDLFNMHTGLIDPNVVTSKFEDVLKLLEANKGVFGSAMVGKFKSIAKFDERMSKYLLVFNYPARVMRQLSTFIDDKLFKKIRTKFSSWIGKAFNLDAVTINGFALRQIGIKQLVSAIVNSILESIGVGVGGPLGGLIATIVSYVVTEALYKLAKPAVKIMMFILWAFIFGVTGLIAGILMVIFPFGGRAGPFQHILPSMATEGSATNPFASQYPADFGNVSSYPNAPDGELCPIYQSQLCSQGTHTTDLAFDIGRPTIWYAPNDGTVTRAEFTSNDCIAYANDGSGRVFHNRGGTVVFQDDYGVTYYIYHAAPLVPAGTRVSATTAVARADRADEIEGGSANGCWTGPHFHLFVRVNGKTFDNALSWYRDKLKCTISGC